MTVLTRKEAMEKYVDRKDVGQYIKEHDLGEKLKRMRENNFTRWEANIRKIKRTVLQGKIKDLTGSNISLSGGVVEWQVLYGRARIAGVVTFAHISPNNRQLHLLVTFACHQIVNAEDNTIRLFLDGEEVIFGASPDPRWSTFIEKEDGRRVEADHKVFMSLNHGAPSQEANADMISQLPSYWTELHKQSGRAGVYLILEWDELLFPGGLPQIELELDGKYVYDPREDDLVFTDNAALIAADYLMDTTYGLRVPSSRVDMDALSDAADICDEQVALLRGGTESRYTINGVIKASDSPLNILEMFAGHMAGNIVYSSGKWKVVAGGWRASSLSITEEDIIGDITITTNPSRKDAFNRIRGTFTDATNGYTEADFPPVKNDFYKAQDNGEEIWEDIQLPLCISPARGQRISKIELERARAGLTATFKARIRCWKAIPTDTIDITYSRFGWNGKYFEVLETQPFQETDEQGAPIVVLQITAKETAEAVYDDSNAETPYDATPNTNLPDPYVVPTLTGLQAESGTDHLIKLTDGTVITQIFVEWDAVDDFFVSSGGQVHVEYKRSADATWIPLSTVPGSSTFHYVTGVIDGDFYDIRARYRNAAGVFGRDYAVLLNHQAVGKREPPSNVQGFQGVILSYGIRLTWDPIPDPDVKDYELRVGPLEGSWAEGEILGQVEGTVYMADLRLSAVYKFMIKARDTTLNYSETETSVSVNLQKPGAPITTLTLEGDTIVFSWTQPTSYFAIEEYEISYGVVTDLIPAPQYENSVNLANTKSTVLRSRINWAGTRYFWIVARDVAGNRSLPYQVTMTVNVPGGPEIWKADVVDNNVLLYWRANQGTLPVSKYLVFKGPSFETAESKGEVRGTFIGLFEVTSGTYTYWVVGEDSAGNRGIPSHVTLQVSQPPDYVLRANGTMDPREAGIGTNIFIEGFGFLGGEAGGGGGGGPGTPMGLLLAITYPEPPVGGPGGSGSPIGVLAAVTEA